MNTILLHLLLLPLATAPQAHHDGARAENEVLRWNRIATDALAAANTDPLTESRALAIVQLSVHDALNSIQARYATYGQSSGSGAGAAPEAAVAAAAHDAMLGLLPGAKATLDEELARSLATIPTADARKRGADLGKR